MFQSAYQDGDCVEVFSPAGKNPAAQWKLSGKVVRLYEKGVKGYVLTVSGGATSKMQLPKAPKGLLGLRQRHLVLQVMTATSQDKPFSLELGLTDAGGTRRRLVLSSSFRALHCTPLHAQIPLVGLGQHRGSWANLSVDLAGLTEVCFRAEAFRTLDLLAIGPTCRLRKIFTMKEALDDASGEDGEGDAQDEAITASSVPGPKDSGGCGPAAVGAVPVRMTFPAGVVPAPRNWVISVSTLRRLASRDVPPPSPSKRNPKAAACSGSGRKARSTPSPRQASFDGGPPSLTSTTASPYMSGESPSVRSRPGGAAERRTPSPGLLEIVAGKPSSNSSSTASVAGLLPRHRPSSSRGSGSSSVATPERRPNIAGTSNIAGCHSPGVPSSSSSPNSGTIEYSTPRGSTGRNGVGTGRDAKEGSTTSFGRTGTDDTRLFRRTLSQQAATTPGSTSAEETHRDEVENAGRGGLLPARQRVSGALLPGGSTLEMRQTATAKGGASTEKGGGGGQRAQAPGEKWRVAGSWNEGKDKHAPAWSFLSGNENEESYPDNMSRMATPRPKRACSLGSPLTPASNSRTRPALASIADLDKYTGTSGLEGNTERGRMTAEESSPLQDLREALPADIDVSWRGGQYGVDRAAAASATRSASSARRRSPKAEKKATHASARSRPSSSSTITAITSDSVASTPTALGTYGRPSPSALVLRRESDVATKTTAAHLFASPFSALGDGKPATRHSSPALHGGTSSSAAMARSPMSARVDVLQNLVAPIATGEQDPIQTDTSKAVSAEAEEKKCNGVSVSTSTAATAPRVKDGGGNVVVAVGENADGADALERLLGHSIIAGDTTSSTRSDNGSPSTNAVSGFVDGIARHGAHCPGVSAGSSSFHQRATDKGIAIRPNQTSEGFGAHDSTRALGRGHGHGGKPTPLSGNNEGGATARLFGEGQGSDSDDRGEIGLMRPSYYIARSEERCEGQKAGPRMAMEERPDELEELERKEIALFDLEESYHTEFGSVDLSQSPEKRSQFTIQSAARSSAAAVNTDTNCSMTPKALRSNCDIERPNRGSFSPTGTLNHRQQSNDSRVSNGDDATDSVVLGSRDSTTSAASREGVGAEATCGRARSPVEGMVGVAKTETRDQGGGVRHDRVQKERGNGELYFDPVLNCYYDRAADKYYELC